MVRVRPTPLVTPMQIAGRFAVLLDFPGFLILDQPPECYGTWLVSDQLPWSDTHPDCRAFVVFGDILAAGRTRTSDQILRKAVRVRRVFDEGGLVGQPIFHNTLVVGSRVSDQGRWSDSNHVP